MRSGTTSLHHWLRGHPHVAMSRPKEVHYFDQNYELGPEWYSRHFDHAEAGQLLGESTPEYLFLPWARERISTDLPGVRVILSLRDPVERAWSHWSMLSERGRETLPFDEALQAEPRRLEDRRLWSRYGYTAKGHYVDQVRDLFQRVGRDSVLVLIFEQDVRARPAESFRRVCQFLEIDPDVEVPVVGETVNAAVHVRSPRMRRWAQPLPKRLRDGIGRLNATAPADREELDSHVRQRLRVEYDASNRALEQLLQREIPEWQRPGA